MNEEILIPLAGIAMIVAIVWFVNVTSRKANAHRADLVRHLVDKFASGEAFAEALQGPVGDKLTEALSLEQRKPSHPWVGLFIPGSILGCLGLGFFVLVAIHDAIFVIPGVIISAVGTGLLLSSYVTWRSSQSREEESGRDSGARSSSGRSTLPAGDGL